MACVQVETPLGGGACNATLGPRMAFDFMEGGKRKERDGEGKKRKEEGRVGPLPSKNPGWHSTVHLSGRQSVSCEAVL